MPSRESRAQARGDVTQTVGTPATCAGITVIINVEGRG